MGWVKAQIETVIAVCALLIAAIAAGASAYQTYVINEQFSATVWPYLAFSSDTDRTAASFSFGVRNVGLGPAVVRSTIVTVDGNRIGPDPTSNPIDTLIEQPMKEAAVAEQRRHQHGLVHTSTSSLGAGDVIPAGSSVTLLRIQGPDIFKIVMARSPHVDVTICYCSVLGRCWTRRLKDALPEPRDVRMCPLPTDQSSKR